MGKWLLADDFSRLRSDSGACLARTKAERKKFVSEMERSGIECALRLQPPFKDTTDGEYQRIFQKKRKAGKGAKAAKSQLSGKDQEP